MLKEIIEIESTLEQFMRQHLVSPLLVQGDMPVEFRSYLQNQETADVEKKSSPASKYATILNWGMFSGDLFEHFKYLAQLIHQLEIHGRLLLVCPVAEESGRDQRSVRWADYFCYDLPHALSRMFQDVEKVRFFAGNETFLGIIASGMRQSGPNLFAKNLEWYAFQSVFDDLNDSLLPPSSVTIEITSRCIHRCRTCLKRYIDEPGEDLPFERYQKIAASLFPSAKTVHFVGFGEPLIHPSFRDMLDLVKYHKCVLHLSTSGALLKEDICRKICEIGGNIVLSLDGACAETFEYIRPGIKWSFLMRRLETLKRIREDVGNPDIQFSVSFVAQRCNIEELPKMVELCSKFNFESLTVTEIQNLMYNEKYYKDQALCFLPDIANEAYKKTKVCADNLGVRVTLPQLYGNAPDSETTKDQSTKNNNGSGNSIACVGSDVENPVMTKNAVRAGGVGYVCQAPWHGVYIDVTGDLMTCCVLTDLVFGNIKDQDPMEIWSGDKFRAHRIKSKLGYPPKKCFHCALFFGLPQGNPSCPPPSRRDVPAIHIRIDTPEIKKDAPVALSIKRHVKKTDRNWKTYLCMIGSNNRSLKKVTWLATHGNSNSLQASSELVPFVGSDGNYELPLLSSVSSEPGLFQIGAAMLPIDFNPDIGFWISSACQTDSVFLRATE